MKCHKQANLHDPDNGVWGDCYRTVLACLLDMERDDVPHYVNTLDSARWVTDIQPKYDDWLAERGVQELAISYTSDSVEGILELQGNMLCSKYPCQLIGMSATQVNHVVIVADGTIIHDPSRNDSGIIGPTTEGVYWLVWLIPMAHPVGEAA